MTKKKGAVIVLFAVWVVFVLLSAYFSVTSFTTQPSETAAFLGVFVFAILLFIAYLVRFERRRRVNKLDGKPAIGDYTQPENASNIVHHSSRIASLIDALSSD